MLSVLIPIYNFDVRSLVRELHQQGNLIQSDFEILCFDDGSEETFKTKNAVLSDLENVCYYELKKNIGRSKIRNKLADAAGHEFLLFLDCDSKLNSSTFLSNFIEHCEAKTVVYGGRNYELDPPSDPDLILRWRYGVERETPPSYERNSFPYRYFLTNNFLIPKAIFKTIRMDETIVGYGHEDTAYSKILRDNNIKIKHIDNPLCHIGLEDSGTFLDKTKQGIENLAHLIQDGKITDDVKIFRFFKKLRKLRATGIFQFGYRLIHPIAMKNLNSNEPRLMFFDLYKLYCLTKAMEEHV